MVWSGVPVMVSAKLGSRRKFSMIVLVLLVGLFGFGIEQAQARRRAALARREDIPFIKCRVCEIMAKLLVRQVKRKRDNAAPKKISEFETIDIAENICNMDKEGSHWILKLDIVENNGRLEVVEQPVEAVCKRDCRTIERACEEVLGEHDTDVAEYLHKAGATRAGVLQLLCRDLSKACVAKLPPLPGYRGPDEAFTPKVAKQAEMDKLMRSLQDVPPGAPKMRFYSREDIQNNPGIAYSGGRDPDDDYEEDDDEDDAKTSQTKPVENERRGSVAEPQGARTQKLMQNALERVKLATGRIKTWWYGKKPIAKSYPQFSSRKKSASDSTYSEEL